MYQCHIHPHKQSFPAVRLGFGSDTLLLFADPALDSLLSFFSCYLMTFQGITNAAFTASERLGHFRLVCVRMFPHIRFQFFWVDLSETSVQLFLSQIPRFFQLLLPLLYRRSGYFECLVGFFQCMPCLSVFYCPFPIFFWITHTCILSDLLLVFNRGYYIVIGEKTLLKNSEYEINSYPLFLLNIKYKSILCR